MNHRRKSHSRLQYAKRLKKYQRRFTKKYTSKTRISPNLPANNHPNEMRLGRDKKMWVSTRTSRGYYQWRHLKH